jgi:hypothetical protein
VLAPPRGLGTGQRGISLFAIVVGTGFKAERRNSYDRSAFEGLHLGIDADVSLQLEVTREGDHQLPESCT